MIWWHVLFRDPLCCYSEFDLLLKEVEGFFAWLCFVRRAIVLWSWMISSIHEICFRVSMSYSLTICICCDTQNLRRQLVWEVFFHTIIVLPNGLKRRFRNDTLAKRIALSSAFERLRDQRSNGTYLSWNYQFAPETRCLEDDPFLLKCSLFRGFCQNFRGCIHILYSSKFRIYALSSFMPPKHKLQTRYLSTWLSQS